MSLTWGKITAERGARAGYCACGCGKPTATEFAHGHNRAGDKVRWIVDPVTGCWNWQLAISLKGHGMTKREGKRVMAHRLVWESHRGPIPEGKVMDHLCHNPRCVNPDHLEIVTITINNRRKITNILNDEKVAAIKRLREQNLTYEAIAQLVGTKAEAVGRVIRGEVWL